MPEQEPVEEAYEDDDAHVGSQNENLPRSSFFFACLSFLLAFICLSLLLNRPHDFIFSLLFLLGVVLFGTAGILFLQQNSLLNRPVSMEGNSQDDKEEQAMLSMQEGGEEVTPDEASSFEQLVEEALSSLPSPFQEKMENLVIVVESEPAKEVLQRMRTKEGQALFGLYEGVPFTTQGYAGALQPEVITIFQGPIERFCRRDPDCMRDQVRRTVLHEIAHHFGIDHDEMPGWLK
jgi:predicted Zn-dependent protease with MMP-like domain